MKKNWYLDRCQGLDERQLLLRGNVFQHMAVLMFALLLANGLVKDEGIVWAEGMWENLLIFWAGVALGQFEFIFRGLLPAEGGMNRFICFEGIVGLLLTILLGCRLLLGEKTVMASGMLTSTGAELIQGCIMLSAGLAFLGRRLYERGQKEREE